MMHKVLVVSTDPVDEPALAAMAASPISKIEWRLASELRANGWNPNVVFNAELALLERSLFVTKWIQPILINTTGLIIDGFHRWSLSQSSQRIREMFHGFVPCAVLDLTDDKAMLMTIRINRAKGTHVAFKMSEIVRTLLNDHHYEPEQICIEIGASKEEVELLAQEGVFKQRDIQNWEYSKAWIPKETTHKKE